MAYYSNEPTSPVEQLGVDTESSTADPETSPSLIHMPDSPGGMPPQDRYPVLQPTIAHSGHQEEPEIDTPTRRPHRAAPRAGLGNPPPESSAPRVPRPNGPSLTNLRELVRAEVLEQIVEEELAAFRMRVVLAVDRLLEREIARMKDRVAGRLGL